MSKLSERYQRALDRERVAVSFRKERAKRVMEKVFEQGKGNSISDRVISVLREGLKAENQDRKARKSSYKDYLKGDSMSDKKEIIEFIEEYFEVPEDRELSEEKSLGYLQGYLAIRLQGEGLDIDLTDVEELDLNYIKGLLSGRELEKKTQESKGDFKMDKNIEKLKEAKKARKALYDGNKELREMVERLKEDENLDEISALKRARREYFQEN